MFDILVKGGVIMIPIGIASLIGVAIIVERLLYFRRLSVDEDKLMSRLGSALEKGHYDEALAICDANPSSIAALMKVAIDNRNRTVIQMKDAVEDAAGMEIPKLERYLSALGTVATVAPLLGLLGTVTGIISAFGVIGQFGVVGDPSLLARGISEALITTAAGLVVSIPATIFYNHLVSRANHTIIRLENRANEMVRLLTADPEGARP